MDMDMEFGMTYHRGSPSPGLSISYSIIRRDGKPVCFNRFRPRASARDGSA